jgi:hypothetical protein
MVFVSLMVGNLTASLTTSAASELALLRGQYPPAAGSPVLAPAIARLIVIASRAAKAGGDFAPSWITAVLTTHAKALTSATPGASSRAPAASGYS